MAATSLMVLPVAAAAPDASAPLPPEARPPAEGRDIAVAGDSCVAGVNGQRRRSTHPTAAFRA